MFASYLCKVSICSHINIRLSKCLTALGLETPQAIQLSLETLREVSWASCMATYI